MKPVVHYVAAGWTLEVGKRISLVGVTGHPSKAHECDAITSRVIRVGENGEFETLNTIYRKGTATA